jgi:precorrin-2/cobalt-factor-2 C20-methyltransferase
VKVLTGKLYGIGVGPGDPELMTIKARRILGEVDCIAIPVTAVEKGSLALEIAKNFIKEEAETFELLFPMSYDGKLLLDSWNRAANQIRSKLDEGKDIAVLTLGDPTVYSTYMYIHKLLKVYGYEMEIIPAVTSFCASAARAGISLAENKESMAIIPSAYDCENLDDVLDKFDNVVLMKVSKNLSALKDKLSEKGLLDKAVLVGKCGLEGETMDFGLKNIGKEKVSYFTTMIIKKNGVR